ncbi:ATP-binding protein [Planococcus salinus]|uniref:ATP-binding protein n=2 Tax=Planococcus salinus TaxID=1848460 RepID=A0A3M8P7K0_9BACL|nr:ATP-binding protein [Planococcus salinus]
MTGLAGQVIQVEATVREDKEQCVIIGLPDASIKESKERILNCLHALDQDIDMKKITIHLSPADVRKQGTSYDAAMLLAVLQAMAKQPVKIPEKTCFIAALTLSGQLTTFHSMIPTIHQAILLGFKRIYIPPIEISLFAQAADVELIRMPDMPSLLSHLQGKTSLFENELTLIPTEPILEETEKIPHVCFSVIRGHAEAKRALLLAAAGGHHVLMSGPPGCGKSLLANAFHTILPDLTHDEMLEVYSIYQLAKQARSLSERPPFRSPHHSSSEGAIVGGGRYPKPGEMSLAHRGVLFLDELGHFPRRVVDTLRQPLESGFAVVNRVEGSDRFPATINLIAATNPCPCGYYGSHEKYCVCGDKVRLKYMNKITGPIIDRVDFVLAMKNQSVLEQKTADTSEELRQTVTRARDRQRLRYGGNYTNAIAPVKLFEEKVEFSKNQLERIETVSNQEKLSSRSTLKILRLARTIADVLGDETVSDAAVEEALRWKISASQAHSALMR